MTETPHRATPLAMATSTPPAPAAALAAAQAQTPGAVQVSWRFDVCPWADVDVWACVIETETEIRTLGGTAEPQPSEVVGARLARVGFLSAESVFPALRGALAETGSDRLIVRVNNPRLRTALTGLADVWGQVAATVVASDDSPRGRRMEAIARARIGQHLDQVPAQPVESQGPLVVATDGSARRSTRESAAAWVCEEGHFGTRNIGDGSPFLAELTAIMLAVKHASRERRDVHVITDCANAAEIARTYLANPRVLEGGHQQRGILRSLVKATRSINVTIEVVRGHQGHHMNELADRLAVLTRRDAWAGVSGAEHRRRAREIAQLATSGAEQAA